MSCTNSHSFRSIGDGSESIVPLGAHIESGMASVANFGSDLSVNSSDAGMYPQPLAESDRFASSSLTTGGVFSGGGIS